MILEINKGHRNVFASPISLPYSELQIQQLIGEYTRKRDSMQTLGARGRRVPRQLESEIQDLDVKMTRLLARLGTPLFQQVNDRQLLEMARRMEFKQCRQDDVIWQVNEKVEYAVLLLTCQFQAFVNDHGYMLPIALFQEGRTVGDKFIVDSNPISDYSLICTKPGVYGVLTRTLVAACGFSQTDKQIDTVSILHTIINHCTQSDSGPLNPFKQAHPAVLREACESARLLTLAPGELVTADLAGNERSDLPLTETSVLYVCKGLVEILARVHVVYHNQKKPAIHTSLIPIFRINAGEFFGHTEVLGPRGSLWRKLGEYFKLEIHADVHFTSIRARAAIDPLNTVADVHGRNTLVVLFPGRHFDDLCNYPNSSVGKLLVPHMDEFVLQLADKLKYLVVNL